MELSRIDIIAFAWFALCWVGYALAVDRSRLGGRSVIAAMDNYRRVWMQRCLARDNRMMDVNIIRNLMRSAAFFASTTIFVLAGLVAILGAAETAMNLLADVAFTAETTRAAWETKVIVLMLIFAYAFFKFSWSLRLYNYCSIVIGSFPMPDDRTADTAAEGQRTAEMISRAARHANSGLRAYYFGLGVLGWFIHPWVFMLTAAWVVLVLYRREFRSATLRLISMPGAGRKTKSG